MSELNTMMNISKKDKKALEVAEKKEKKEQEALAKKAQIAAEKQAKKEQKEQEALAKKEQLAAEKQVKEQAAAAAKQEKLAKKDQNKVTNKGTGAGGANTNKNGLAYEELTDLSEKFKKNIPIKKGINEVEFEGYERKLIQASKDNLKKYMKEIGELNEQIKPAPGCKEPDEAYVDPEQKIVFIIEKKFQQGPGSVDEKIQTSDYKLYHYKKLFPNYKKIYYMYCLSDWFKRDEYKDSLIYLEEKKVPVFWGSSETYKQDIIEFIHNSL
jgi:hypothetical protein